MPNAISSINLLVIWDVFRRTVVPFVASVGVTNGLKLELLEE